jgi:hypothetical protein
MTTVLLTRCTGLLAAVLATGAFPPPACAQDDSPTSGSDRTSAYLQVGFSTARPHMSGIGGGGSLVVQLGRRLALEGSGSYLDRGAGAAATTLSVNAVLDLGPPRERAVPYLVMGGGAYRASFDTRDRRFIGAAQSGEMGTGRYRHLMQGNPAGWDLGQLPSFYGERLAASIARDGRNGIQTFTDPALAVGAGVRIRLGRAWSMRQDARALVVMSDGRYYTAGMFTLQVGR